MIHHPDRSHVTDPTYRRVFYEGATFALLQVDRGWSRDQLAEWLHRLSEWRYDPTAGELPPEPRHAQGGDHD
jgi:hypothetical protein